MNIVPCWDERPTVSPLFSSQTLPVFTPWGRGGREMDWSQTLFLGSSSVREKFQQSYPRVIYHRANVSVRECVMPSIKDFVAALQAGWFPALVALMGCSIVIAGDHFKLPYLSATPQWLLTTGVIVGVFSFSIISANIVYAPVYVWKKIKKNRRKVAFKQKIEKEFSFLPEEEIAILAYLVTTGRKAFSATFDDNRLVPLVAKGFIIRLAGVNSILDWPYIVQADVWDFLMANREQLIFPNAHELPSPFGRHSW